jgi:diguanylate cyclase
VPDLVELGLKKPAGKPDRTVAIGLTILVDRLLEVIGRVPPEATHDETTKFQTQIAQLRTRFQEVVDSHALGTIAESCLKTCDDYLRRARQYQVERVGELTELVTILREAAAALVGDSAHFHAELLQSTENLTTLAAVDDIREIKERLAAEVTLLRSSVARKQQRDSEAYAALSDRVDVLQTRLDQAEQEAGVDQLTRIPNRRSFDRTLVQMAGAARRQNLPLTVAMIDVDNFKAINDQHGHQVGDRVLVCVAQLLAGAVRRNDFVARYGGEEFVALLRDAPVKSVEGRLNALLTEIANTKFDYAADGETRSLRFTVSCGAAELNAHDTNEEFLRRADEALYEAKRKGKNRFIGKKRSILGNLLR